MSEAIKNAIEAMEFAQHAVGPFHRVATKKLRESIAELKAIPQAQAGQPIAAVHGWFHGECVIRAIDPEAVLPAGMALYSQPQAQAGDGEAFCDANCTWLDHHKDCAVLPLVWMSSKDAARAMIASEGERAEVAPDREDGFDVPLYAAPPAAVNRQDLIELLIATRTQSEGVTADLIIKMVGAKPAVTKARRSAVNPEAGDYANCVDDMPQAQVDAGWIGIIAVSQALDELLAEEQV